jgi:hypothetical protein
MRNRNNAYKIRRAIRRRNRIDRIINDWMMQTKEDRIKHNFETEFYPKLHFKQLTFTIFLRSRIGKLN